jgi:hypothetical protein
MLLVVPSPSTRRLRFFIAKIFFTFGFVRAHLTWLFDAQNYESEYLVLFSNVPSHALFAEVIFPIRLNVACVLLAAQGGFSGQLFGFEQYRDIPKILLLTEKELGLVDVYFLDKFAHDNILLRPISPYISRYEQLESSLPCGCLPWRAFMRPVLS